MPSEKSYTIEGELTITNSRAGIELEFSDGENTLAIEDWLAAALEFSRVSNGFESVESYGRVRMTVEQVK